MKKEEFQQAMEELLRSDSPIDQEFLDEQIEKLKSGADKQFGPGVYIKALLDRDNGGVLVTFKRPTLGERHQAFVQCDIADVQKDEEEPEVKPKRKTKASSTKKKKDSDEDDGNKDETQEETPSEE